MATNSVKPKFKVGDKVLYIGPYEDYKQYKTIKVRPGKVLIIAEASTEVYAEDDVEYICNWKGIKQKHRNQWYFFEKFLIPYSKAAEVLYGTPKV